MKNVNYFGLFLGLFIGAVLGELILYLTPEPIHLIDLLIRSLCIGLMGYFGAKLKI